MPAQTAPPGPGQPTVDPGTVRNESAEPMAPEAYASVAAAAERSQQFPRTEIPTITVGSGIGSYSPEDLQSAYAWVADFIPRMYSTSGFWRDGQARTEWNPRALWSYSEFTQAAYWNDVVNPMILDLKSMNANKAFLVQIAPLPPKQPSGRYWSLPAVENFTYGDATFTLDQDRLVVSLDYTAQAVTNDKSGTFYAAPLGGSVAYTLVREADGWRIAGWRNTVPVIGESTRVDFPIDRSPTRPWIVSSASPTPIPLSEVQKIQEGLSAATPSPSPSR